MDQRILLGALIGFIIIVSVQLWKSLHFTKEQKIILMICGVFAPLQWTLAIILYYYNKSSEATSLDANKISVSDAQSDLYELKENGVFTEEEFQIKKESLENDLNEKELYDSREYQQLKSLLGKNILSDEEFNNKVNLLLKRQYESNQPQIESLVKDNIKSEVKESFSYLSVVIFIVVVGVIYLLFSSVNNKKIKEQAKYESYSTENVEVDTSEIPYDKPFFNTYLDEKKEQIVPVEDNIYFIYCSVYFEYYDAVSGMNGYEPTKTKEGIWCTQIIELEERYISKFNEKFRNQYAFNLNNDGYGYQVDKGSFKINKFKTYEEALELKSRECDIENELMFLK